MAKLSIISLLSSFFTVSSLLPLAYSQTQVTNIRFYVHDIFDPNTPVAYGDVFAFQNILTVGPDPDSTILGRAQGTIAFTNPDALSDFHVSVAYIFTSGRYNGSSLVAVGRSDDTQIFRQFPIIGGTGAFMLARGIVTSSTYSTDPPVSVYEYDLEIIQDHVSSGIKMKLYN